MSRRRELSERIHQLTEIREIMDAMKNLAVLETHKITHNLQRQRALAEDLERIADDFLDFYTYPAHRENDKDCWILFGSQRGFCGNFNESLLEQMEGRLTSSNNVEHFVIAIGDKLNLKLAEDPRITHFIEGADVAEEITRVLNAVVVRINHLQARHGILDVFALFVDAENEQVSARQLMPPFTRQATGQPTHAYAPVMNLTPDVFFTDLLDRYLFVALQEILCTSLMAENQKRIQHMTGAVRRLDETTARLVRRYHMHRQEEITEEIEVLLINASTESSRRI